MSTEPGDWRQRPGAPLSSGFGRRCVAAQAGHRPSLRRLHAGRNSSSGLVQKFVALEKNASLRWILRPPVIASEAKQSRAVVLTRSELLRRFASRNDGCLFDLKNFAFSTLAHSEAARGEAVAFGQGFELGPDHVFGNAAHAGRGVKAAIGAGDHAVLGSRSLDRRAESANRGNGLHRTDSGRVSMPGRGLRPPR